MEVQITHSEEKTWGVLTHLLSLSGGIIPFGNILGPVIMWILKKEESDFVDENGKSSINFNLSFMIYYIVLLFSFVPLLIGTGIAVGEFNYPEASMIFPFALLGIFVLLLLLHFVLVILAAIKTANGEVFRYPLSIRFLK